MADVFHERFPEAEVVTSDFVDFADRVREKQLSPPSAPSPIDVDTDVEVDANDDAESGDEQTTPKKPVGTVVFNSVFGNLWDQGAALERAAAILSVKTN